MFLDFDCSPLNLCICLLIYLSSSVFKCKLGEFSFNIWSSILLEMEDHTLVLMQSFAYVVLTGLCKPGTKGKKYYI